MSTEHCCCGYIHVRTGALIIGCLGIIFGIIGLLAFVVTGNGHHITGSALNIIIGGCIIYADKYHKPGGYLPYLIVGAIGIVFFTVFIIFNIIVAIAVPGTLSNHTQAYGTQHKEIDSKTAIRVMFFFVAAVMAFLDCIAIWFWMVVYRAYQHMKGVEEYDRGQTYQVKLNV